MEGDRKLIGQGKTANVYLDHGYAYKEYAENHPIDWIKYEVQIQNEVADKTKLPVIKYSFTDNPHIIKMPYINGGELTNRMRKDKYKYGVEDLVNLQIETYNYDKLDLPLAFVEYESIIKKSTLHDDIKQKALKSLSMIERKEVLCHFDFHFSNIMYDGNKYYIIDWNNAKLGNPVMDIARTYIILRQYAFRLAGKYLKIITKKMKLNPEIVKQAIPLMAALRLLEKDGKTFNESLIQMINSSN